MGSCLNLNYLKGERSVPLLRRRRAMTLGLSGSSVAGFALSLVVWAVLVKMGGTGVLGVCFVSSAAKAVSVSLAICSISIRSA